MGYSITANVPADGENGVVWETVPGTENLSVEIGSQGLSGLLELLGESWDPRNLGITTADHVVELLAAAPRQTDPVRRQLHSGLFLLATYAEEVSPGCCLTWA